MARTGRPPVYSDEKAAMVCSLIEGGKTIDEIELMDGMPCWETMRTWLKTKPDFLAQYARAREASAEMIENEALRVARTATDKDSAAAARVVVDTLKWMAGKRNPKVYGERMDMNVTGKVTLEAIVQQAYNVLPAPKVIEGELDGED